VSSVPEYRRTGHSPHVEGKHTQTNGLVELSESLTTTDVTVQAWDFKPRGKQTNTHKNIMYCVNTSLYFGFPLTHKIYNKDPSERSIKYCLNVFENQF
jgi:hypothetical protein